MRIKLVNDDISQIEEKINEIINKIEHSALNSDENGLQFGSVMNIQYIKEDNRVFAFILWEYQD